MKKLTLLLLSFPILFMGFSACRDSDNDKIPIKRVEATTEIDLSKYERLGDCSVNGEDYDYVLEGNKVIATPKKDGLIAYIYPYDSNMDGGISGVRMYLTRHNYASSNEDQSTFEKMMYYDALIASEGGDLPSVITGLTLKHRFSMLSFTIKNLPQSAVVTTEDLNEYSIIPYLTESGVYQCISQLALQFVVSIKVGNIKYQTKTIYDAIISKNRAILQDSNNFYKFEVVYNPDAEKDEDKLVIQNGTIEPWINQHFEDK